MADPHDHELPWALVMKRRDLLISGVIATLAAGAMAIDATAQLLSSTDALLAPAVRPCCVSQPPIPQETSMPTVRTLTAGNQQAMELARTSRIVMQAKDAALALASSLANELIRQKTLDVLQAPAPTYQLRSPTPSDKQALRQDLLAAGLIPDATTIDGIFPPVPDPHEPPQPFWSAPGSGYDGHHAFPGGLAIHEWVNATLARGYGEIYEAAYGLTSATQALDPSITLAAPLWHDIQKVVVFQWNEDGRPLAEQVIAGTGAHHPLSGAEAIVRGMSPDFVIALLSAHDPPVAAKPSTPSTTVKPLINYLRAAAMIARVDPIDSGLLVRTGDNGWALAQGPPRMEGYINHLADHDYVLSGDSATVLDATLRQLAPRYGIDPDRDMTRFNWFRNATFSHVPDMRLYGALATGGLDAVKAMIDAEADLGQHGVS
jgi:hypothetical protein